MKQLSMEETEYAVKRLEHIAKSRDISQVQLQDLSGVNQSTISKIFSGSFVPSYDTLKSLFNAIGLRVADVTNESECHPDEILGYLATPLTSVVQDESLERGLRQVVSKIKGVASEKDFEQPRFALYWPGDHTHPIRNPGLNAHQVYRIDRSRASSYDFLIIFCGSPSYGVGQENEIATQAGLPAIRLLPAGVSRMLSGSFIRGIDIQYTGTLDRGIRFDEAKLRVAFTEIRQMHYQLRALYKNLNGHGFGNRIRKLVDERWGDYPKAAADLGISLPYLHVLIEEPLRVSNPSALLLSRMAHLFGEKVGYLLGDAEDSDPIWVESQASWRAWINNTPNREASIALSIRDEWRTSYRLERAPENSSSFRRTKKPLRETDWERRYQERVRHAPRNPKPSLFKEEEE
jgi:transcriptional regulator with XRE-family HTH domain